jgi:hypothetical protein
MRPHLTREEAMQRAIFSIAHASRRYTRWLYRPANSLLAARKAAGLKYPWMPQKHLP